MSEILDEAMQEGLTLLKDNDDPSENVVDASDLSEEEIEQMQQGDRTSVDREDDPVTSSEKIEDEDEGDSGEDSANEDGDSNEVLDTETVQKVEPDTTDKAEPHDDENEFGSHEGDEDHEKFGSSITKKETAERFKNVLGESKKRAELLERKDAELHELREQSTTISQKYKTLHQGLFAGGLEISDVSQVLPIAEAVKSFDAKQLNESMPLIREFVKNIETITGQKVSDNNLLGDFPELEQQVSEMDITKEAAEEIARGRVRQRILDQRTEARQNHAQQSQQANQQTQQEFNQALGLVKIQIDNLKSTDIDYKHKSAAIQQRFEQELNTRWGAGTITMAGMPSLLHEVHQAVTLQMLQADKQDAKNVTNKNTLRGKPTKTADVMPEIDMGSDNWVHQMMKSGLSQ